MFFGRGCSEEDVEQIIEEMKLEWKGSLLPGSHIRAEDGLHPLHHLIQPLEVDAGTPKINCI